jgi:hypothetical protein
LIFGDNSRSTLIDIQISIQETYVNAILRA